MKRKVKVFSIKLILEMLKIHLQRSKDVVIIIEDDVLFIGSWNSKGEWIKTRLDTTLEKDLLIDTFGIKKLPLFSLSRVVKKLRGENNALSNNL